MNALEKGATFSVAPATSNQASSRARPASAPFLRVKPAALGHAGLGNSITGPLRGLPSAVRAGKILCSSARPNLPDG